MAIPPFNGRGLLPPFLGDDPAAVARSPYVASMQELVERFGTTQRRRELLRGLISYREMLSGAGYTNGIQYVDGSFVEDVNNTQQRDPDDIDVFSFLHAPQKYVTNAPLWLAEGKAFWANEIVNRDLNKGRFFVDTYGVIIEEQNIPDFLKTNIYWYGLFSHQRDTLAWKGFAAVPIDAAADVTAAATLEAMR